MKKTLVAIGAALAVGVVAILAYAATKPDSFRIERSANIKAPPEKIFPHLADLRAHGAWSPWEKKDPAMKRAFSGTASGKGQVYEWDGNSEIGKGRIEIADIAAPAKVAMNLHFIKPFEAQSRADFTLKPNGDGTTVTWAMYGPQPFVGKVMGLFIDCDKMVGKEFETGLASLKAIAEK